MIVSELYKIELFPNPLSPVIVVVAINCWFCARVDFPINGNLKLIFCLIAWDNKTVLTSDFIAKTRSCQLHVKLRYSSVGNDIWAFSKSPIFFSFVPFTKKIQCKNFRRILFLLEFYMKQLMILQEF